VGVVVGASCGVIGNFLAAFIAARWFRVRQGLVVGVLTAANAAGQLIFLRPWQASRPAPLARDIAAARGFGGGLCPADCALDARSPEDLGLAPYGGGGFRPAPALDGNPLTLAFRALGDSARSRDFWLIAGSYFVCAPRPTV